MSFWFHTFNKMFYAFLPFRQRLGNDVDFGLNEHFLTMKKYLLIVRDGA